MADEDTTPKSQTQDTQSAATGAETAPEITPPQNDPPPQVTPAPEDRTELLQRARAFLSSPQVRHEDLTAKRRFLGEKGLSEDEIEGLLREVVRPIAAPLTPLQVTKQHDLQSPHLHHCSRQRHIHNRRHLVYRACC